MAKPDQNIFYFFQAGTGDEFLDELLSSQDAVGVGAGDLGVGVGGSLEDGAVPDIKVMDSETLNMSTTGANDGINAGTILDFFNQLSKAPAPPGQIIDGSIDRVSTRIILLRNLSKV